MSNISKEFAGMILSVIDGITPLNEFEQFIYSNKSIENEISPDEYLELISFNYKAKDAHAELNKILYRLLDKYLTNRQLHRDKTSIQAVCISNKGSYQFNKHQNTFSVTVGKYYDILTIHYDKDKNGNLFGMYVIIDDDESVFYIPSSTMRIEHKEIPTGWIIEDNEVMTDIEPKEWKNAYYVGEFSFWEDFHNYNEHAIFEFIKVLHRMNIEIPHKFQTYAYRLLTK